MEKTALNLYMLIDNGHGLKVICVSNFGFPPLTEVTEYKLMKLLNDRFIEVWRIFAQIEEMVENTFVATGLFGRCLDESDKAFITKVLKKKDLRIQIEFK